MNTSRILLAAALMGVTGLNAPAHAQGDLRGQFRITRTTTQVLGAETAAGLTDTFDLDEELQWQVYVPANYDRQNPAGAFVFVDPSGWGGMPDQYRPVFDGLNMIWIGANQTDPRSTPAKLIWTTIMGSRAIQQDYEIDLNRLYLGGKGGGALTALNSMLASSEFSGLVQISGSVSPGNIPAEYLDTLKRRYFVFLTGSGDKARVSIRKDHDNYRKYGLYNTKLIYDTKGSRDLAKPELVDEAIRFLDSRLR